MADTTFESQEFEEGIAFYRAGKVKQAFVKFLAASQQYPEWAMARHNAATCLRDMGRSSDAIAMYREVLAITPTFVRTLTDLAIVLEYRGDMDEALRLQELAIVHTDKGKEYAHFNHAHTLARVGETEAAIANYRAAIAINGTFSSAHYNLGLLWKRQENREEAVVCFREVVRCDPDDTDAFVQLATNLSKLGRTDEAIPLWEHYLTLFPNDSPTLANLGCCVLAHAMQTNNPQMLGRCRALLFKSLRRNPLNLRAWLLLREYATT